MVGRDFQRGIAFTMAFTTFSRTSASGSVISTCKTRENLMTSGYLYERMCLIAKIEAGRPFFSVRQMTPDVRSRPSRMALTISWILAASLLASRYSRGDGASHMGPKSDRMAWLAYGRPLLTPKGNKWKATLWWFTTFWNLPIHDCEHQKNTHKHVRHE